MTIVCRGVRGAITVDSNEAGAVLAATRELLERMVEANGIRVDEIASVIFSTTPDLDAEFPARAARELGWLDTAFLCTHEMQVPGGLPRCIRVLLHWNTTKRPEEIRHVYLREARRLRPDRAADGDAGDGGGPGTDGGSAPAGNTAPPASGPARPTSAGDQPDAAPGPAVDASGPAADGPGHTAILGLGLIGGSLALALRSSGVAASVIGYDADPMTARRAASLGAVDRVADDLGAAVAAADTVVLAAPVRSILELLDGIEPLLRPGTLLIDVGSTKRRIVERLDRLPAGVRAVGGHPMCGKEHAGIEHAEPGLFSGATFALCPTRRTDDAARRRAERLVAAIGARPLWLDAGDHDAAVASVSHLPYVLAVALVRAALDGKGSETAARLAASGFRDTSRLAASNERMMLDILATNGDAVLAALDRAAAELDALRALIAGGDAAALAKALAAAAQRRRGWTPA